jgi:putative copper export protein
VHVVAASVWFGGVTFLTLDLRWRRRAGDPRGVARVVGRFSTLATLAVVAAAGTGSWLAWSQLGELQALWATAYGRAFLAKMSCVALVVGMGGYNREFLVPALAEADGPAVWHRLRRTMTGEMLVMGLGVLLATALMTSGGL